MLKHPKGRNFLICIDILFKLSAKQRSFIRKENQGSAFYTDQSKYCSANNNSQRKKTIWVNLSWVVFVTNAIKDNSLEKV